MKNQNFCSKCGNKLDINDNFCSKCGSKIEKDTKEYLNENYNTNNLLGSTVLEHELVSAKFVIVKKERFCNCCNKKISKNEVALTSSAKIKLGRTMKMNRIWWCINCGKSEIKFAMADDEEKRDTMDLYCYDEF